MKIQILSPSTEIFAKWKKTIVQTLNYLNVQNSSKLTKTVLKT